MPSRTRLRLFHFDRAEFSTDDEVVVVERQRARNTVLVELEANGVSRCLVGVFLGLTLIEIADRNGPAWDLGKFRLVGCRIIVFVLAGPDFLANDGKRIENLVA